MSSRRRRFSSAVWTALFERPVASARSRKLFATGFHLSVPGGLTVKIQIDEISRRLAIVADEVAHQDIEHVIIDWNGFAETGHD